MTCRKKPCSGMAPVECQTQEMKLEKGIQNPACQIAAILAIGFILFYRSPRIASDLPVVPDSVEYAAGARSIAFDGKYAIRVCDQDFPPRYSPWFSLFLAPIYKLSGAEPGNAIFPVTVLAAFGLAEACAIGRILGGPIGGLFAAMATAALPDYQRLACQVMSDVPCSSLLLASGLVYLRLRSNPGKLLSGFAAAGLLLAVAGAFRPAARLAVIPFLLAVPLVEPPSCRLPAAGILFAPSALVAACDMMYNRSVFGSPFRTGYHFWCPVPYEFRQLVFSPRYFLPNLGAMLYALALPLVLTTAALFFLRLAPSRTGSDVAPKPPENRSMLRGYCVFVCSGVSLVSLLHLFYFFPASRFHLPLAACLSAASGGLLGRAAPQRMQRFAPAILAAMFAAVCVVRLVAPPQIPHRRVAAMDAAALPPQSVLISTLDPVYLDLFVPREKHIRIVPLSRQVEYASKMTAPRSLQRSGWMPAAWNEHRREQLQQAGAVDAVPWVAEEWPEGIASALAEGRRTFLCMEQFTPVPLNACEPLLRLFRVIRLQPNLYELTLSSAAPDEAGSAYQK